jgi:hypothetical protein
MFETKDGCEVHREGALPGSGATDHDNTVHARHGRWGGVPARVASAGATP